LLPLQTTVPGVFAIGDVRAVGEARRRRDREGAAVVSQIHGYLAQPTAARARADSRSSRRRSSHSIERAASRAAPLSHRAEPVAERR